MTTSTRRRLLRRLGGALAAGTATGLAGCAARTGSGTDAGSSTPTASPTVVADGARTPDGRRVVDGIDPATAPVAIDGVVAVVTGDGVAYGIEAATGVVRWAGLRADGDVDPVVGRGAAVVADGREAVGVAARDGGTAWRTRLDAPIRSLAADGGRVVAATDGGLVALRLVDGTVAWRRDVDGAGTGAGVAAGDGVAVVGLRGGDLLAVGRGDGGTRWRTAVDGVADPGFAPVVGAGRVLVAGDRTVVGLATDDGAEAWRERGSRPIRAPPATTGDAVYVSTVSDRGAPTPADDGGSGTPTPYPTDVASYGADLRALSPADGGRRWRASVSGRYNFTSGLPSGGLAAGDGLAVLGVDGDLHAFDARSGERAWSAAVGRVAATVVDEVVTTGTAGVDAATGTVRWTS